MKKRIAGAVVSAVAAAGLATPAHAAISSPKCEVNGDNSVKVNISLCVQASYKNKPGKREAWKQLLVGVGVGGKYLEETNGAIVRNVTVQKPNGDYVENHWWDNIWEYEEDRYRRFYDLDRVRARYLKVCVRGDGEGGEDRGYELLVDHGKNRFGEFCFKLRRN